MMAQYHEPQPLEQRPSKNIGLAHYVKEIAPAFTAVVLGMVTGALKGHYAPSSSQARLLGAVSFGSLLVSPFLIWRKEEKQNIGIHEVYDHYKEAMALRMDNTQLAKENALLREMVEYENHQTSTHVKDIVAHGPKEHGDHHHDHSPKEHSRS